MLMMGSKTVTVEGVTVFADHADPAQFWYLPAPVVLAEREGVPQFTLIRYRPAVAGAGVKGGGFLMMEVELRLDPEVERKIIGAVARFSNGTPRLTPVPFDDGKVQVIALNVQGSGGTMATPSPAGAFVAVEAVLGATKPSLGGNNTAIFSLTLSEEGSTILDQAFRQGATPVGVIYDLKYTALRPALDVKITANFKRIYDRLNFSVDLTAGAVIYGVPVYLEAGIDMAFEKLKQDGVIDIKVINFSSAADQDDKEKWALDFFKQNLLQQWFQPTLAPVTFDRKPPAGGTPPAGGGGAVPASGGASPPAGGAPAGGSAPSGGSSPRPAGGEMASESTVMPMRYETREVWAYAFLEAAGRAPAQFTRTIDPETPGYDVQMTQRADSDEVTLLFLGASEPPIVFINGTQEALSDDRQATLTLAAGATVQVEATYRPTPGGQQEFRLYFDFDKPRAQGWSVSPPSAAYGGYLANRTTPLDSRFETSTGQPGVGGDGAHGADALRGWLGNTLGSPRRVTVESHASYEGNDGAASLNQDLTQRRADVAVGIIGTDAQVTSVTPMGFSVARAAGRSGSPEDRYALVRGASAEGRAVTIRGTLSRAAAPSNGGATPPASDGGGSAPPASGGGTTPPASGGGSAPPASGGGGTAPPASGGATPPPASGGAAAPKPGTTAPTIPQQPPLGVKLAFRLQKIEQIEDKTVTLQYNRQSAEQRSFAPQGLIGLLADDLDGPPHFIEVDLDSPFFRELAIQIDAPSVFDPIGLMKADVAIEYGRATDPVGIKHKDISFRPGGANQDKASFFLNPKFDLSYTLSLQYHFNPLSGWDGEKLSYDLPPVSSLDRTLLVNPFRDFGFHEIRIVPGDIDPDMVDSTDVFLHYEHPGQWSRDTMITVTPGDVPKSWKLRLSDPEQRWFTYRWVHRLKDGSTKEIAPLRTNIPLITVNDPFDEPLIIELYPNYDASQIRLVIVDLSYQEKNSTKKRTQQIKFQPTEVDSRRIRFGRTDRSQNTYTMQITVLGVDNSVRRLPPVNPATTTVFLGEYMAQETLRRRVL
ncbi:hypothetical protein NKH93_03605 [Mesorhizobium sp. M0954]|uniref:hypothetical protein n=1 Tax=Mesorhizobium sp. M0954 TaxID=2957032 RepID=UPI00333BFA89